MALIIILFCDFFVLVGSFYIINRYNHVSGFWDLIGVGCCLSFKKRSLNLLISYYSIIFRYVFIAIIRFLLAVWSKHENIKYKIVQNPKRPWPKRSKTEKYLIKLNGVVQYKHVTPPPYYKDKTSILEVIFWLLSVFIPFCFFIGYWDLYNFYFFLFILFFICLHVIVILLFFFFFCIFRFYFGILRIFLFSLFFNFFILKFFFIIIVFFFFQNMWIFFLKEFGLTFYRHFKVFVFFVKLKYIILFIIFVIIIWILFL